MFCKSLSDRAALIYEQISPYLINDKVLSPSWWERNVYGSTGFSIKYGYQGKVLNLGHGYDEVGILLRNDGHEVTFADGHKSLGLKTNGKSRSFVPDEELPFPPSSFDTVLALNMLHYNDNPIRLIAESKRVTKMGGRVVAIESVYGINGDGHNNATKKGSVEQHIYFSLDIKRRHMVSTFFDHFYNSVIQYNPKGNNKASIPLFNTPGEWREVFEREGLKQEKFVHFGVSLPTAPGHIAMHILRKE